MTRRRFVTAVIMLVILALAAVPFAFADGPTNRTERAEVRFLEGMIDHHQMALDMAHHCLMVATTESLGALCQSVIDAQSREIQAMRGWLLIWYGIEYHPMSMMGMQMGGMMQGGMGMGMMGQGMAMMYGGMGTGMMPDGMMGPQSGFSQATPGPGGNYGHHGGMDGSGMGPGMMQDGMMGPQSGSTQSTPVPGDYYGYHGGMDGWGMGMMGYGDMPGMMGHMAGLHHLTGVDFEIAWLEAMIDHHDDALHMSERILGVTERPELRALAEGIIEAQTAEIELMEGMIAELGGETL